MTEDIDNRDIDEAMAEEEAALDATTARLGELESELSNARDRHLRLAAEFDNYRKRIARDQSDMLARAQASLVAKLAEVLDDLDRVAHHSESATKEALLEGVELVERKLRTVLETEGLERFDPTGLLFDPAMMEALTTVPADNPEEDDHVATVFAPGYRFQGTLIRPARVVVKKHEG